jgi:hypothetical protein
LGLSSRLQKHGKGVFVMTSPVASFAYVFAANAARIRVPTVPPPVDEERWRRDLEAEERETAARLNSRKRSADRRPPPDRP